MNDLHFARMGLAGARPVTTPAGFDLVHRSETLKAPAAVPRYRTRIRVGFSIAALLLDVTVILAAAFIANYGFNFAVHGTIHITADNMALGVFAALLFAILNAAQYAYSVSNYLDLSGHAQRTFVQWNTAFIAAAALGFMMKAIEESSRGTFVVLYFVGLFALYAGRAVMVHMVQRQARNAGVLSARVVVVGFRVDIARFMSFRNPAREAINVIAVRELPETGGSLDEQLADVTRTIRDQMPDDIYLVLPWSQTEVIDKCISAFMEVPASIHLNIDPGSAVNRLGNAVLGANGSLSSLSLRANSMKLAGALTKRGLDIALSVVGLLALSENGGAKVLHGSGGIMLLRAA